MSWESDDEEEEKKKKNRSKETTVDGHNVEDFSSSSSAVKEAPFDKYRLMYIIVALNGICTLLPWNMFINIAPNYYVKYWFSPNGKEDYYGRFFMQALGITAQAPNFIMAVVNATNIIRGSVLLKIRFTLITNSLLVIVTLILVCVMTPSPGDEKWFFIVSLIIVMALQTSNGLYQNSLYGLTADFPDQYTNAIVIGDNICGTFISVLQIITTVAFPGNPKTVAILYFSISLIALLLCTVTMFFVRRNKTFNYYIELGHKARLADNAIRPSLRQYWETVTYCWTHFLSVFLVFFVTLSVFPSVLVDIKPLQKFTGTFDEIYSGLTVFLNFNFFAGVGNFAAVFVQIPGPRFLLIPVVLRILFIPFFMLCNFDPEHRVMAVVFKSAWFFIFGNTILAFTSGYFSSLAMMYAPGAAPAHLQKTAGQIAALCLVGGVVAGVAFTPVINIMVERIH